MEAKVSHLLLEEGPNVPVVHAVCDGSPTAGKVQDLQAVIDAEPLVMVSQAEKRPNGLTNIIVMPTGVSARALLARLAEVLRPIYRHSVILYICALDVENEAVGVAFQFITNVTDADYTRIRTTITDGLSRETGSVVRTPWQGQHAFVLTMGGTVRDIRDLANDPVNEAGANICSIVQVGAGDTSKVTLTHFINRVVEDGGE